MSTAPSEHAVSAPLIDMHTHGIPPQLPALADRFGGDWPHLCATGATTADLMVGAQRFRAIDDRCWDPQRRLEDMDAEHIAIQVVSPIPVTFSYALPADGARELADVQNHWIAELVRTHPQRFAGLGTVPLQDGDAAAAMVPELINDLGLCGIEIGSNIAGQPLDSAELQPFYSACEEAGAVLFVHPWQILGEDRLRNHGLLYAVGMPAETAVAAATLIVGGVLDRHPRLNIALAHGGGALLAMTPRIQRCVQMLPGVEPPVAPIVDYLRRFWFDSLVYDADTLSALVSKVGCDRVMVGSDYPFPVGERPVGHTLTAARLSDEESASIGYTTAAKLFNLRHT